MTVQMVDADGSRLDDVMQVMTAAFDRAFGEAWTRSQCAGILPMAGVRLMLAQDGDSAEPLGFALYRTVADDAELLLIAVAPQAQGRGIGRELLDRFVREARTIGASRIHLEVREGNPAVRIYQAAGFEAAGRRRHYYNGSDGRQYDALTFVLA